jgi:hypothetical protein
MKIKYSKKGYFTYKRKIKIKHKEKQSKNYSKKQMDSYYLGTKSKSLKIRSKKPN